MSAARGGLRRQGAAKEGPPPSSQSPGARAPVVADAAPWTSKSLEGRARFICSRYNKKYVNKCIIFLTKESTHAWVSLQ